MKCAIHLFPKFAQQSVLDRIREQYDPLVSLIPPHITLVFPFESPLSTAELIRHVRSTLADSPPFRVALQDVTGSGGEYLFLCVKRGNDDIIALHDQLYTGDLASFLSREVAYLPHLTVGRLEDSVSFQEALLKTAQQMGRWETKISEVVIESISEAGASIVEAVVPLLGIEGNQLGGADQDRARELETQFENVFHVSDGFDFRIRNAISEDVARIVELMHVLGYPTTIDEMMRRLDHVWANPRYLTLVAVEGDLVVGMIGMEIGRGYEFSGRYLRILALVVDASAQGRGIGQALVAAAEAWATLQGAHSMLVTSGNRPERVGAHSFYRRAGFEAKGTSFRKGI